MHSPPLSPFPVSCIGTYSLPAPFSPGKLSETNSDFSSSIGCDLWIMFIIVYELQVGTDLQRGMCTGYRALLLLV